MLHQKLRRLLPRPFEGEGRGEGLLGVAYPAVLAVFLLQTYSVLRASNVRILAFSERGHSCPMPLAFDTPHPERMNDNSGQGTQMSDSARRFGYS